MSTEQTKCHVVCAACNHVNTLQVAAWKVMAATGATKPENDPQTEVPVSTVNTAPAPIPKTEAHEIQLQVHQEHSDIIVRLRPVKE